MTENHAEAGRTTDVPPHPTVEEAGVVLQEGDQDHPAAAHEAGETEETSPPPNAYPNRTAGRTTTAVPTATTTAAPTMLGPITILADPEARITASRGETPLPVTPEDPATDRTTCPMRNWP